MDGVDMVDGMNHGTDETNEGNTRGRALGRGAGASGFLILAFLELITGMIFSQFGEKCYSPGE